MSPLPNGSEAAGDELLGEFLGEALPLLQALPEQLTAYRQSPGDAAPLHSVFRAVHSIKGNAAFLGLGAVSRCAHRLEDVLEEMRSAKVPPSDDVLRRLVGGLDALEQLLRLASDDGPCDPHPRTSVIPASTLLGKFARLAQSLAAQLGKHLEVQIEGEDLAIASTHLEPLELALVHLVRNACDHGIEPPHERLAAGKPPRGRLMLKCELLEAQLFLIVADDGRGIDLACVRQRAIQQGLVHPAKAAALCDDDAIELIFLPGFSTAQHVSEISGRGVGMDVVRATLREHGGEVRVISRLGRGTTCMLSLPFALP